MPMIDLTITRGTIAPEALDRLTDELVTALLRAELAPDTPFLRDSTVVYVHQLEADDVRVGGRPGGAPRFRVELTVFAGALDGPRTEQLVADVHACVCAAAGIPEQGREALRVWTFIREVPEGAWAAAGRLVRVEQVQGLTGADLRS